MYRNKYKCINGTLYIMYIGHTLISEDYEQDFFARCELDVDVGPFKPEAFNCISETLALPVLIEIHMWSALFT